MQATNVTVRLFLADDHQIVRMGLRTILAKSGGIQVVGEASNADDLLRALPRARCVA